jgi:hypothetical protein
MCIVHIRCNATHCNHCDTKHHRAAYFASTELQSIVFNFWLPLVYCPDAKHTLLQSHQEHYHSDQHHHSSSQYIVMRLALQRSKRSHLVDASDISLYLQEADNLNLTQRQQKKSYS